MLGVSFDSPATQISNHTNFFLIFKYNVYATEWNQYIFVENFEWVYKIHVDHFQ